MTSDSDLKRVYGDIIARGRMRIDPPTAADVEALFNGELDEPEAERVREQLAYYPDMAKAMSDQQFVADLQAIDNESVLAPATAFRWRSTPILTLAASLVIVLALGGIYLKTRERSDSRPTATRVLDADGLKGGGGTRGSGQTPIQLSTATDYWLKPVFRPQRPYGDYRLELIDLDSSPPRSVWSQSGVQRESDGSFPVKLSTAALEPGLYELVLYGVDGGKPEELATYTMRFSEN